MYTISQEWKNTSIINIFFALVCYKQKLKVIKESKHVWQKNEEGEKKNPTIIIELFSSLKPYNCYIFKKACHSAGGPAPIWKHDSLT